MRERTSLSTAPICCRFSGELVRLRPQLAGQFAELLSELRARILGLAALRVEILGQFVEAVRLPVRRLAYVALLGDHEVLRVRKEEGGHEQGRGGQRRERRPARETRA